MNRQILQQRWLWISAAALLAVFALLLAQRLQQPAYKTKLRELGYPATMEEVEQAYFDRTSPEAGAAYQAAYDVDVETSRALPPEPLDPEADPIDVIVSELAPSEPLSPELQDRVQAYCDARESVLRAAYHAAAREAPRLIDSFGSDYIETVMHYLAHMRSLARLVRMDLLRHVIEGDTPAALQSVDAILAFSNALASEPFPISQMVRVALFGHAQGAIEELLNRAHLSPDQLASLQQRFVTDRSSRFHDMQRAFAAEIVATLEGDYFDYRYFDSQGGPIAHAVADFVQLAGLAPFERTYYAHESMRLLQSDGIESGSADDEPGYPSLRGFAIWITLIPSARTLDAARRGIANTELARTAIALERYRLDHGEFPETLNAFVPNYLDAVPTDPFTESSPLRYLHHTDRVVVYSVERDRIDNQGNPDRRGEDGWDLPLTLYTPGHRAVLP